LINDNLREQLSLLPGYLGAHITVAGLALLVGLLLSLPLGLLVARSKVWSWLLVSGAGMVQTIPGLALLALMVPLLGSFGFWPAVCALVLYSMLPVLRNTVTGLTHLEPAVLEAARGVGMTPGQVLRKVEIPLALPLIIAGIRTAAVWVIGIATLSTPVGQASLGNFIFAGLQTRNWEAVLVGCVAAAALALIVDGLLAALERGVSQRHAAWIISPLAALVLLGAAGSATGGLWPSSVAASAAPVTAVLVEKDEQPGTSAPQLGKTHRRLRIGAKTFTEQYILARVIERRASAAGLDTERVESLGSTIAFEALRSGRIDVYVDYTGTIYANYMAQTGSEVAWRVEAATAAWLGAEHGIRQLGALGFQNAYALALRREMAERTGIRSIADLMTHAPRMKLGSDYEFFQRPEWVQLQRAYVLEFAALVSFDSSFMYSGARDGAVDVITAFSSDGRLAAYDLVVLDDPKASLPPYDAVLLLAPQVANDERVVAALRPLVGSISVQAMRAANWQVDREQGKRSVADAAAWLDGQVSRP
jgi:osmoprotectant transport system permease protein